VHLARRTSRSGASRPDARSLALAAGGTLLFAGTVLGVLGLNVTPAAAGIALALYVDSGATDTSSTCGLAPGTGIGEACSNIAQAVGNASVGNADAGDDVTVNVAAGTYPTAGNTTTLTALDSASTPNSITVTGDTAADTIIDGQGASGTFPAFAVSGSVELDDLTVTNMQDISGLGGSAVSGDDGTYTFDDDIGHHCGHHL